MVDISKTELEEAAKGLAADESREMLKLARIRRAVADELEARKKGLDAWIKYKEEIARKEREKELEDFDKAKRAYKQFEADRLELIKIQKDEELELEKKHQLELAQIKLGIAKDTLKKTLDVYKEFESLRAGHSKKMFAFFKAMAIAEAVISTSKAIMKVLGEGVGPMKYVEAAHLALMGAAEIATISAAQAPQSLARGGLVSGIDSKQEGGLIPGTSPTPTSDDKIVRVTSGEFFHPVDAVKFYGLEVMEGIRQRVIPPEVFAGLNLPSTPPPSGAGLQVGGIATGVNEKGELNIYNLIDPREIDRYMYSARAGDAVINILSSRAQSVRKIFRST